MTTIQTIIYLFSVRYFNDLINFRSLKPILFSNIFIIKFFVLTLVLEYKNNLGNRVKVKAHSLRRLP